jgi:hypothetical protein
MPCWKQKRARYAELLSFVFPFRTSSLLAHQSRVHHTCILSTPDDERGGGADVPARAERGRRWRREREAECSAMGVTENRRACACTCALQLGRAGVRSGWGDRQPRDQAGRLNGNMSSAGTTWRGAERVRCCALGNQLLSPFRARARACPSRPLPFIYIYVYLHVARTSYTQHDILTPCTPCSRCSSSRWAGPTSSSSPPPSSTCVPRYGPLTSSHGYIGKPSGRNHDVHGRPALHRLVARRRRGPAPARHRRMHRWALSRQPGTCYPHLWKS